jgi:tRNA A-37 threonylcarbamoyl transferase component Bud32
LKSFNPDRLKYCVRKMHSYNLVHKDIKPANILYSKGVDDFILLDFGLSHAIKERIGEKS